MSFIIGLLNKLTIKVPLKNHLGVQQKYIVAEARFFPLLQSRYGVTNLKSFHSSPCVDFQRSKIQCIVDLLVYGSSNAIL